MNPSETRDFVDEQSFERYLGEFHSVSLRLDRFIILVDDVDSVSANKLRWIAFIVGMKRASLAFITKFVVKLGTFKTFMELAQLDGRKRFVQNAHTWVIRIEMIHSFFYIFFRLKMYGLRVNEHKIGVNKNMYATIFLVQIHEWVYALITLWYNYGLHHIICIRTEPASYYRSK